MGCDLRAVVQKDPVPNGDPAPMVGAQFATNAGADDDQPAAKLDSLPPIHETTPVEASVSTDSSTTSKGDTGTEQGKTGSGGFAGIADRAAKPIVDRRAGRRESERSGHRQSVVAKALLFNGPAPQAWW